MLVHALFRALWEHLPKTVFLKNVFTFDILIQDFYLFVCLFESIWEIPGRLRNFKLCNVVPDLTQYVVRRFPTLMSHNKRQIAVLMLFMYWYALCLWSCCHSSAVVTHIRKQTWWLRVHCYCRESLGDSERLAVIRKSNMLLKLHHSSCITNVFLFIFRGECNLQHIQYMSYIKTELPYGIHIMHANVGNNWFINEEQFTWKWL